MANNTPTVRWPTGNLKFYSAVICARDKIMQGRMLSIDPSSASRESKPGYALREAGKLVDSGVFAIPHTLTIEGRLRVLNDMLAAIPNVDVLTIELIPQGLRHHQYLDYSIGATLVGCRATTVIHVPIVVWKALARVDGRYIKGDQQDAVIMNDCVYHIAKHGT